jgi:hypothetical protein
MTQQGFTIKADTKGVEKALDNTLPAAFARESIPALEEIADGVLARIKRTYIFDGGHGKVLKEGLWRGNVRSRRSGAEIDLGWSGQGASFGPGHEWGFSKARWMVKPVGTKGGKPIKALRFVANGRVMYSKGHMVRAPRKLKPHFQPAVDAYPVEARLGKAMDRAVQRAGL